MQQDADYPGIVPILRSEGLFERELTREEKSVRGMLVTGLTDADMFLLDIFEGDVGFLSYFEHGLIEIVEGIPKTTDRSSSSGRI